MILWITVARVVVYSLFDMYELFYNLNMKEFFWEEKNFLLRSVDSYGDTITFAWNLIKVGVQPPLEAVCFVDISMEKKLLLQ